MTRKTPARRRALKPAATKLLAAIVRERFAARFAAMSVEQFAEGLERLRCTSIADYRKKRTEQLNAQDRS
jgi:hypothetical protein